MQKTTCYLLLLLHVSLFSQSNWKRFKDLSGPKKTWVLTHPFQAKKALAISLEARKVADSIRNSPLLDGDPNGGQVDAFRHAYWMARLRQAIGKSAAKALGKAHERENYQTYKKNKLEDGTVPDEVSSVMDLYNNSVGLSFTIKGCTTPKTGLVYRVINAIRAGKLKIIKKNSQGIYLDCANQEIPNDSLLGKWKNSKCLIDSNP